MEKCSITQIFADENLLPAPQQVMPCWIAEFPVKYLGLPLSTKILKAHLHAIVDKVAARLPLWQGPLMPQSSRLVLIKTVLTSIPIYILMAEKLPPWAIDELNNICRRFFWAGHNQRKVHGQLGNGMLPNRAWRP